MACSPGVLRPLSAEGGGSTVWDSIHVSLEMLAASGSVFSTLKVDKATKGSAPFFRRLTWVFFIIRLIGHFEQKAMVKHASCDE